MEVYDHLRNLFRLPGPETEKKVGHGIEYRKYGLQIGRHRLKAAGTLRDVSVLRHHDEG